MQNETYRAVRGRAVYKPGMRAKKVKRLSTRVPPVLGAYINQIAASIGYGYMNRTYMLSVLMHRFLEDRPWDESKHGANAFKLRGSKREGAAFHVELQPVTFEGATVSGADLRTNAEKQSTAAGVSGSTFLHTFLWWIALVVHPAREGDPVLKELANFPADEPDKRFTSFMKRPRK